MESRLCAAARSCGEGGQLRWLVSREKRQGMEDCDTIYIIARCFFTAVTVNGTRFYVMKNREKTVT
jgi:hypothetical protein